MPASLEEDAPPPKKHRKGNKLLSSTSFDTSVHCILYSISQKKLKYQTVQYHTKSVLRAYHEHTTSAPRDIHIHSFPP